MINLASTDSLIRIFSASSQKRRFRLSVIDRPALVPTIDSGHHHPLSNTPASMNQRMPQGRSGRTLTGQVGSHRQIQGPAGSIQSCRPAALPLPGRTLPETAFSKLILPSVCRNEDVCKPRGSSDCSITLSEARTLIASLPRLSRCVAKQADDTRASCVSL